MQRGIPLAKERGSSQSDNIEAHLCSFVWDSMAWQLGDTQHCWSRDAALVANQDKLLERVCGSLCCVCLTATLHQYCSTRIAMHVRGRRGVTVVVVAVLTNTSCLYWV